MLDPGVHRPLIQVSTANLDPDVVFACIPGFSLRHRASQSSDLLQLKAAESVRLPELQLMFRSWSLTAAHHLCQLAPWVFSDLIARRTSSPDLKVALELTAPAWQWCQSWKLRLLEQPLLQALSLRGLKGQPLQTSVQRFHTSCQGNRKLVAATAAVFWSDGA